jgi:uncharacterized protein (DUF58 family)
MTPSSRFMLFALFAASPLILTPFGVQLSLALSPTMVLLFLALADRLKGTRTPLEVTRRIDSVFSVGIDNNVRIEARNLSRRAFDVELADLYPANGSATPEDARLRFSVAPHKTTILNYSFAPSRRGVHTFTGIQLRHLSRLGLWVVRRHYPVKNDVHVYPNIEALHRFELLARVNNLHEFGIRSTRMKGEGTEFERLREFRMGDEPRKVDWKTTAKLGKLIVREMGQERNQNVMILVDMGRMMRQTTEGLSHFDYALNTAIILGHIAADRGDNVGAVFFSNRVKKFVPLGRGRNSVNAIVHAGYDIEPEQTSTNYSRLFRHVATNVRKRSLLLLVTHMIPGEDHRLVRSFLTMLGRQHLPLCLFFREPALEEEVSRIPKDPQSAFRRAAAADILLERSEGLAGLHHAGVLATNAMPGELSTVAISNYLDIKARNLL